MKYLRIYTLEKGWHDKDEMLLHAVFQLLVDYIEKEKPDEIIDWNVTEESKKTWTEISTLYNWWTTIRPARVNPLEDKSLECPPLKSRKIRGENLYQIIEPDKTKFADFYNALVKAEELEKLWFEEDQNNLHQLVDLREHLWT